jgi:hypothetical protein
MVGFGTCSRRLCNRTCIAPESKDATACARSVTRAKVTLSPAAPTGPERVAADVMGKKFPAIGSVWLRFQVGLESRCLSIIWRPFESVDKCFPAGLKCAIALSLAPQLPPFMRQRRHTSGHITELLCDLGTDRCALQMFTPGLQEPRIIMISLWAPQNVRTLSCNVAASKSQYVMHRHHYITLAQGRHNMQKIWHEKTSKCAPN